MSLIVVTPPFVIDPNAYITPPLILALLWLNFPPAIVVYVCEVYNAPPSVAAEFPVNVDMLMLMFPN